MTEKEQIAELIHRVKVLEQNVQQLQQQVNDMPGTVKRQLAKAASRRLG